jgi:ADP-ribose pyrophosphatase YjhB (NUDIX family)
VVAGGGPGVLARVGRVVRNREGRFLFFERVDFPPRWTVPSGHVDTGETPEAASARELKEEVGLSADLTSLVHIGTEDIVGDSCRRGADAHRWHAYLADLPDTGDVQVIDEGHRPVWLTLAEALERTLTVPVRQMLARHVPGGGNPVP